MKQNIYILTSLVLLASCRPVKKVQRIEEAISRKDTAQTVVIAPGTQVDSASEARRIISRIRAHNIDFKTFSARVKVDYEDKDGGDQATANIRIQKDSLIWIQLTGPLGIEGMRLLVSPDSVVLMNKQNKTVQYRSISYLQELTQIPFDFQTLQDMILGNPVFIDSTVASYRVKENETVVMMTGPLFKHLLTLDNSTERIMHSKLDDANPLRNRTCDISFSDYENLNGYAFATKRRISVAENNKLDISLDFKNYALNQPLSFPFSIPKNYKVK